MYNERLANRLIETLKTGYKRGLEGIVELYPTACVDKKDIDCIPEENQLCVLAFSLASSKEIGEPTLDNLAEIQDTIEVLIKSIEGHIITGEKIDIDIGDYAFLILQDLIHIDKICKNGSKDFKITKEDLDNKLNEAVDKFCSEKENENPELVAIIREAHSYVRNGDVKKGLQVLRKRARELGYKLPEDE